ncbi:hypothetical protein SDC9_209869 [bioreactor metagenome]|uniref:Uncharacterized protein n=1 Tax=bioreactor metagenome TaxID=1076179 RepID=A0A645JFZ3_9ZZZZ
MIDFYVAHIVDGAGVIRQMRERHSRAKFGKVNLINRVIFGIGIGFINDRFAVTVVFDIRKCLFVGLKDAVLGTRLNGHIRHGQPSVDREMRNAVTGELHGFIKCTVHTDFTDDVKDNIFARNPFGRFVF